MRKSRTIPFQKVMLAATLESDLESLLHIASMVCGNEYTLSITGLIEISEPNEISGGARAARQFREKLAIASAPGAKHVQTRVIVAEDPIMELEKSLAKEKTDLLIMEKSITNFEDPLSASRIFQSPPCSLALLNNAINLDPRKILLPLRGGPYAELALRMALSIAQCTGASVEVLHVIPKVMDKQKDTAFNGIARVLRSLPEIKMKEVISDEPASVISETAKNADLVIMGMAAGEKLSQVGITVEKLFHDVPGCVMAVKNRSRLPADWEKEVVGKTAISVLVDRWFAENTYHADEFQNLERLVELKQRQGLTISLALPALNEEETVGNVIGVIKKALLDDVPLLDEIVLVDSNSRDRTREIARDLNVPVYIHQDVLPDYGVREGKGEALWKSLYLTRGDIVLWIDTDIINIIPHFVYGLIGPFLENPNIQFVKGFYRRPIKVGTKLQDGGGGRVTELTARPLLNLLYPELSGIIQPLAGEYGGRRSALENLPFFSGYGVEIGLLIGLFEQYGLNSIAQVDLQERIHRNQSLEALSKMSFAIIQTVFRKLEARYQYNFMDDINKTMKIIRQESGYSNLEVHEIAELERPPMNTLAEYIQKFKRP